MTITFTPFVYATHKPRPFPATEVPKFFDFKRYQALNADQPEVPTQQLSENSSKSQVCVTERGCQFRTLYSVHDKWINEHGAKLTEENRNTRTETCVSATLSTTNFTRTYLGSNPDIRADGQATNRLSHHTTPPPLQKITSKLRRSEGVRQWKSRRVCTLTNVDRNQACSYLANQGKLHTKCVSSS